MFLHTHRVCNKKEAIYTQYCTAPYHITPNHMILHKKNIFLLKLYLFKYKKTQKRHVIMTETLIVDTKKLVYIFIKRSESNISKVIKNAPRGLYNFYEISNQFL